MPRLFATLLCYTMLSIPLPFAFGDDAVPATRNSNDKHHHGTLQYSKWSGDLNVPDPVAIDFDTRGRAYVTQTQRRKSQDLDIRQNRDWVPDDLSFQSVADKLDFYHRELALGDDEENATHVADMNQDGHHDYRDLMVLSEKIHLLQDRDQDGVADTISEFASDFRTEVTGIAAGVMHHAGSVYATIAPDVWRLQDVDDDGKADQREIMATGFGLHIAYAGHDMHGLTIGPDGKIYWSIGDKGISSKSQTGQHFLYPNQGGVLRCNPDGSEFEVFAHGLRNIQELAFDQFGNLFGVDNDADNATERERFVYIVKGMDGGWRCNYQYRGKEYLPWMAERLWQPYHTGQPSYIVPPISHSIDGPAGFAFNPGTALSPAYKDYFFLTGAPNGNQIAFRVEPNGASFRMVDEHKIGSGIPLVGINFAPDGGLYGVDWGGGYPLNQSGAVWKIDSPEFQDSAERQETKRWLAALFAKEDLATLRKLLAHADQRVRLKAQFELVDRDQQQILNSVALDTSQTQLARIHAIWGLGQLADGAGLAAVLAATDDSELLTQVLRTAGDLPEFDGKQCIPFLTHVQHRVQFAAALALADHPVATAIDDLVRFGNKLTMEETYSRFALASAMSRCGTAEQLADLGEHASELVKLAAVVALRRQASPLVAHYLLGTSEQVATEAALAIHDDFSIMDAMPELATVLDADTPRQTEALVRRAINANFRLGNSKNAARLVRYATGSKHPTAFRLAALKAVGEWSTTTRLDRVTGRARNWTADERSFDASSLQESISTLVGDADARVAARAIKTASMLKIPIANTALASFVRSADAAAAVRIEALNLLENQRAKQTPELALELLRSADSSLRIHALDMIAKQDPDHATPHIAATLLKPTATTPERQAAVVLLGEQRDSVATDTITLFMASLSNDTKTQVGDIYLEVLEAAQNHGKHDPKIAAIAE